MVLCLLLVVATLAAYNPVNRNGFVNFDDDHYITNNPHVTAGLSWDTVKWAFSNYYEANWHPLTWLSHALDCQLFGLNPVGHHYTNVFLHAVNAMLLFWVLQAATRKAWPSFMVAALFALHPVNVESVAWASERKNVLSMMFLLLTLQCYGWYAKRPAAGRYAVAAILFACGLMAKPQVITLPFVLLLWDYWPLRRLESVVLSTRLSVLALEKVPLFGLALASAVITMKAQKAGGAIHNFAAYAFHIRLENAVVAYSRYIGKAFWPTRLSPLYPHPLDLLRTWQVVASALLLAAVTALVIKHRQDGYLVTGWFWFVGTLVPMIGLIQVGEQAMADRYAYLPFVGLFLMVCWGLDDWGHTSWAQGKQPRAYWLAVPAVAVLGTLGWLTYRQIGYWRDSETLWSHALQVTSVRSYKTHFNLAMAYDQEGRFDEAIQQLRQAVDPGDDDPQIHLGLGIYDQRHGHTQDAIAEFETALRLTADPGLKADAYSNLGSAYRQLRDYSRAQEAFTTAVQLNPKETMALVNLGLLAQKNGGYAQAIALYTRAMSLEPTAVGYILLAKAEALAGHDAEAQAAVSRAKQITKDFGEAQQAADELQRF
ncbi:MAG: tetratricopeptide repeat protein [Terriglobales bacterium]